VNKKTAIDMDGFLTTTSVKGTYWIPAFLCLFVLKFFKPKPRVEKITWLWQLKKQGRKIIILSARPERTREVTKRWLKKNKVPFNQLILVGPGKIKKKKLKELRDNGIEYYFGDNPKMIDFLNKKGIEAKLG
jgi:uncharacterized HAD superfamily protein